MQGMPRREAGLRAGGAGVERGYAGLSSLLMSKENQKSTSFARLCAGQSAFSLRLIVLF
jgi:hypothetical protein